MFRKKSDEETPATETPTPTAPGDAEPVEPPPPEPETPPKGSIGQASDVYQPHWKLGAK
jgi:hypothetical protein